MFFLSITGAVRMILMIIAVFVVLRFVGRLMTAKRNLSEEKRLQAQQEAYKKAKDVSKRREGKVHIVNGPANAEDVDFEEVD